MLPDSACKCSLIRRSATSREAHFRDLQLEDLTGKRLHCIKSVIASSV